MSDCRCDNISLPQVYTSLGVDKGMLASAGAHRLASSASPESHPMDGPIAVQQWADATRLPFTPHAPEASITRREHPLVDPK
ncbi:uncharacterized protein APUU_60795A [Aspergillus puulaauensis]|uniref:Uncharacterized protein n=1 Tax=Aspergillus puulaauensis TaxID=1220207 RepID=A0A7R8AR61_9EURO|nr:uncharacterized protein APUU_60795A [Aspergillus puulaauensis]BCS27747.1 hypothetical protein APUU_60795A [Aspergillus puulaauensis]